MSDHDQLASFVSARTGIDLARGGIENGLRAQAARRERELGVSSREYLALLALESSAELERLVNAITVGYTWFFRDPEQLLAIEALMRDGSRHASRLRIWVPGCSTGEDVYSLAFIAERAGRDIEILGTDVNSGSIELARRGVYGAWSSREVDPRYADLLTERAPRSFEVDRRIAARVRFARHNLLEPAPLPAAGGGWDVILCRNVLIYFERKVAVRVLESLARSLAPGGHLVLGASEVVCEPPAGLEGRYVAARLMFRRAFDSNGPISTAERAEPRDWLIPAPAPHGHAALVSAFPAARTEVAAHPSAPPPTDEVDAHLARGHRLIEASDAAGALAAYLDAQRLDPERADAHMHAGIAHYLCGALESALHALRAALFLDDGLWPAALYLGLCHENSGHPAEALQAFQQVVRIDERDRKRGRRETSTLDAWRDDLCDLARRRVRAAASGSRVASAAPR
jgi:chemotaxis protein methyltransferase CheR